jgi:hypothetical protein
MENIAQEVNSRLDELKFIISIFNDLSRKYAGHNVKLLEELISNLEYRKRNEELTIEAKAKSENTQLHKSNMRHYNK